MKLDSSDYRKDEKANIRKLYLEGYNPHEIAYITHLTFYEVIYALKQFGQGIDIPSIIAYDDIDEKKVIFIADTHLGSIYENLDYLREVYKYAKDNDIHVIIHGGDLIQSTFTNVSNKYRDEMRQVEHVVIDYPSSKDITNYILLGNHDFNTMKKHDIFWDTLSSRKDFNLLGFKRAYLTWLKNMISVNHSTKKYHLAIPKTDTILSVHGHSHQLSYYKDKTISIPTLSDDLLQHQNARPGFLVGTQKEGYISLDSYYFKESLHHEGRILNKKIH